MLIGFLQRSLAPLAAMALGGMALAPSIAHAEAPQSLKVSFL